MNKIQNLGNDSQNTLLNRALSQSDFQKRQVYLAAQQARQQPLAKSIPKPIRNYGMKRSQNMNNPNTPEPPHGKFLGFFVNLAKKLGMHVYATLIMGTVFFFNFLTNAFLFEATPFSWAMYLAASMLMYGYAVGAHIVTKLNVHEEVLRRREIMESLRE